MKINLFAAVCGLCFFAHGIGQSRPDSISAIQQFGAYYDIRLESAEADSLLQNLVNFAGTYKAMHQRDLANDVPYPFSFNPAPYGYEVPKKQEVINWQLPVVKMPANKTELAYYSVAELASLIKTKKISSLELTRFFIARLKKFGDTLKCVITLTEDLALGKHEKPTMTLPKEFTTGLYTVFLTDSKISLPLKGIRQPGELHHTKTR